MLSYRHGYHAGNHADVFKHLVQFQLISHLKKKAKPFIYLDTHSGGGRYDLSSDFANKTEEYKTGVAPLLEQRLGQNSLAEFVSFIDSYFEQGVYPGSPEVATALMREQDRAILMEKHNSEIHVLKGNYFRDERVAIHHRDGNEGLVGLVPPAIKRGLVLMDPAYELPGDYQLAAKTVKASYKKWATGTYAVWYPMLAKAKDHDAMMQKAFSDPLFNSCVVLRFWVQSQPLDTGMYGSAMMVVNPPWQFAEQMESKLSELLSLIGGPDGGFSIDWLVHSE